jgi:protocatechuate 3,4-dioxygenase beta subunit
VAGSRVHLDLGRDGGIPYMPGMEAQNRYGAVTDKSGGFRLIGLPPGTHKIRVEAMDPLLLIEPADVKVAATGDHALEIVAHITGSLSGTVHDADGKPLTYEFATLRIQQAEAGGKRQYSPFANAEGKFKVAGMVPGKYNLTVQLGRKAAEKNLVAPEPIEVVIREAQEATVDVKVGTK